MTTCRRNTKEKLNQGKYICPTARPRCIKQFLPNHSTKFLHQIQVPSYVIDQIIPFFLKYAQIIKSTPAFSNGTANLSVMCCNTASAKAVTNSRSTFSYLSQVVLSFSLIHRSMVAIDNFILLHKKIRFTAQTRCRASSRRSESCHAVNL